MMSGAGRRPDQARSQCDATGIGQPNIKQYQVDWRLTCRCIRGGPHRVARGVRDRCHRKPVQSSQIRLVGVGDQRLVLDDQHVDHVPLTVTVITDP